MPEKQLWRMNAHYALIQGLFWGGYATIWAFLTVLLLYRGFSNSQIGVVSFLALTPPIVVQPGLAALADRDGRFTSRRLGLALVCLAATAAGVMWAWGANRLLTAVLYVLIGVCLTATQPFFSSMAMEWQMAGADLNFGLGRGIGSACYAALVLLLLLLVRFTLAEPPDTGEGLMINFGNVTEAAPGEDLAMNDEAADAPQQTQAPSEAQPDEQEQMTQQTDEDVPVVKEEKKPEKKPKKEQVQAKPQPKPQQPAEKPREVNRKALFPGRTEGSSSRSEGTGTGTGNQGDLAGTPEGSHEGTGTGTDGNSASLSGRSLVGGLPSPDYRAKDQGRVVIEIVVDQQGRVTSAAYRAKGSTTQNSVLVNAALKAARGARFNVDESAPLSQTGTITYNFRMQ